MLAASIGPAIASTSPAVTCRATKLGDVGKYASGLMACSAKAASTGSAVDSVCTGKSQTKLEGGFTSADAKSPPSCNGVAATTEAVLDTMATNLAGTIPVPPTGGTCASQELKGSGKFAAALLKAHASDIKSHDATKLSTAIDKARSLLSTAFSKAEGLGGCATGQLDPSRTAIEAAVAAIVACIGSESVCVETSQSAGGGDTVSTDPSNAGASAAIPVTSSVETPNPGVVQLRVTDVTDAPPSGYAVLSHQVDVTAPDATTTAPLVLTFVVDSSVLPADPNTVTLTRNGVAIPDCTGPAGQAVPDPCLQSRTVLPSGDLQLVALSSHASTWTPVQILPCPTAMQWTLRADTAAIDRATEIDLGWKGFFHNMDPVDGSSVGFALDCGSATPPNCGACTITGYDPVTEVLRCENDSRVTCDQPGASDAVHCGGNFCDRYTTPPTPMVPAGTPICTYRRANTQASGTWDPVAGQGAVTMVERMFIFTGSFQQPCPICIGDPTPNDGVRGGTCSGGPSNGLTCDDNGSDPSYPTGGGSTSYDCMPPFGANIVGSGLPLVRTETTGTATLSSGLPCSAPNNSEFCPCEACSGDPSVPCSADSQCAALGDGTCSDFTGGDPVQPNNCSDGNCVVDGQGEGTCGMLSDNDHYCDAHVEEDGKGIYACNTNMDCAALHPIVAGNCTISQPHPCFGATIQASGIQDTANPRTVAAFCVAPSSNGSVNSATGLPGPARLRSDWNVTYSTN
ncbi:MAG TPA: hypothetical protein VGK20_09280 [Candidatus Binatia bacterium]